MASEDAIPRRSEFRLLRPVLTRWGDNDVYGHINNVVYYAWFDTVVNAVLIERGIIDIAGTSPIFVVAETGCRYLASLAYPETAEIGLAVEHIGRHSIIYRLATFRAGEDTPLNIGRFVHVLVDRSTRDPVALPDEVRSKLADLC
jgi:acyl-CoA thioester hydrolase